MVKVCVIKSCPSGRKRRTAKGSQAVSFFRPSSAIKVRRWAQSLAIDLKPTDYVCQHHFKEEHIKLYETIKIGDIVHMIQAIRKTLKEDALPTVEYQSQINLKPQKQTLFQYKTQNSNDEQLSEKKSPEDKAVQVREEKVNLKTVDNEEETQSDSFKLLINKIEKLSVLPPCWCYHKNQNHIEFMRMDPTTKQITNHILLNEDLSVTVICLNNKLVKLNDKVTSVLELYKYLISVEMWMLCVGTQIKAKKHSNLCRGVVIVDEDLKKSKMIARCKPCRAVRNQMLVRRSVANVADKVKANKQLESACKRHTESLIEQSRRLKQMYEWVGLSGAVSLSHGKPKRSVR